MAVARKPIRNWSVVAHWEDQGQTFSLIVKNRLTEVEAIGWPKSSARKVTLPFGRERWVISDDHLQIVLQEVA